MVAHGNSRYNCKTTIIVYSLSVKSPFQQSIHSATLSSTPLSIHPSVTHPSFRIVKSCCRSQNAAVISTVYGMRLCFRLFISGSPIRFLNKAPSLQIFQMIIRLTNVYYRCWISYLDTLYTSVFYVEFAVHLEKVSCHFADMYHSSWKVN